VQTARKVSYLLLFLGKWCQLSITEGGMVILTGLNGSTPLKRYGYNCCWYTPGCFHAISYVLPCSVAACLYRQIHMIVGCDVFDDVRENTKTHSSTLGSRHSVPVTMECCQKLIPPCHWPQPFTASTGLQLAINI